MNSFDCPGTIRPFLRTGLQGLSTFHGRDLVAETARLHVFGKDAIFLPGVPFRLVSELVEGYGHLPCGARSCVQK